MIKKIQAFLNSPIRITVVVAVCSVLLTAGLSYIFNDGAVPLYGLGIALVCGSVLPYWTSNLAYSYQEQLGEKNIALERLASELQASNEQLATSNSDLEAYAHTVAHDLKNPLTVVRGGTELLIKQQDDLPLETRRELLSMINLSSLKMDGIIHDLLLLASLREADVTLEPIEMESIFAEAQGRVQNMIDSQQVNIIVPETWPLSLGVASWVEAIWTNYLSNAIKYGGNPAQVEVGATAVNGNQDIRFWVKDNGKGLSLEEQEKLFSPFERLGHTTATGIEGHGIGLSIVQRIIDKLQGQVGVESDDSGSTFFFILSAA